MNSGLVSECVTAIHGTATQAVFYVTGGGTGAISALLRIPGASGTVLEVRVPYSRESFLDTLNGETVPVSYASADAAGALARAALKRAVRLAMPGVKVIGVGAACALSTQRERRGMDCIHVAIASLRREVRYGLALGRDSTLSNAEIRGVQEDKASAVVLHAVMEGCEVESEIKLLPSVLSDDDEINRCVIENVDPILAVLDGTCGFAEVCGERVTAEATCANIILPGSFNPVHRGHRALLDAAMRVMRERGEVNIRGGYELSARNPDKGVLEVTEVSRRTAHFQNEPLIISGAALFVEKAQLYRGAAFVVGYDTAERLVMPKYYGGLDAMVSALAWVMGRGSVILVGARVNKEGTLKTLADMTVPAGLHDLFIEIPVELFREDVSSTELRESGKGGI